MWLSFKANPNLRAEFKPSVQGLFEAMTDPDSQACRASINTLEIFLEYGEPAHIVIFHWSDLFLKTNSTVMTSVK